MKYLILSLLFLNGCQGFDSLIRDLNERSVQSCIYAQGSYGPFIGISVISATGGATIEECKRMR